MAPCRPGSNDGQRRRCGRWGSPRDLCDASRESVGTRSSIGHESGPARGGLSSSTTPRATIPTFLTRLSSRHAWPRGGGSAVEHVLGNNPGRMAAQPRAPPLLLLQCWPAHHDRWTPPTRGKPRLAATRSTRVPSCDFWRCARAVQAHTSSLRPASAGRSARAPAQTTRATRNAVGHRCLPGAARPAAPGMASAAVAAGGARGAAKPFTRVGPGN